MFMTFCKRYAFDILKLRVCSFVSGVLSKLFSLFRFCFVKMVPGILLHTTTAATILLEPGDYRKVGRPRLRCLDDVTTWQGL